MSISDPTQPSTAGIPAVPLSPIDTQASLGNLWHWRAEDYVPAANDWRSTYLDQLRFKAGTGSWVKQAWGGLAGNAGAEVRLTGDIGMDFRLRFDENELWDFAVRQIAVAFRFGNVSTTKYAFRLSAVTSIVSRIERQSSGEVHVRPNNGGALAKPVGGGSADANVLGGATTWPVDAGAVLIMEFDSATNYYDLYWNNVRATTDMHLRNIYNPSSTQDARVESFAIGYAGFSTTDIAVTDVIGVAFDCPEPFTVTDLHNYLSPRVM